MPEPNSTAAGIVIGSSIGLSGLLIGAQVDALLIGMAAAILASIWMPAVDNRLKAASSVGLSTLLAAYSSPVIANWLANSQDGLTGINEPIRLLSAMVIGSLSPAVFPVIVTALQSWIKHKGEA